MLRRASFIWLCLAFGLGFSPIRAQGGTELPASPPSVSGKALGIAPLVIENDPAPLLGYGLAEAISRFGSPSSVRSFRGEEVWQDDVAFIYQPGYTLFWFGDRLWQLRFTAPYAGTVYGLFIGDPSAKAYSTLGQPYETRGDALVYRLEYRGYPVRLNLVFAADRLTDVYVYRADY
jgi:hypothetical protein